MNHKMKKTVLIMAFFVFFINYHGFAGPRKEIKEIVKVEKEETPVMKGESANIDEDTGIDKEKKPDPGEVKPAVIEKIPVTDKIVDYLLQKDGSSNDLKFYLSKPITMKIKENNETADIEIKDNMLILNPVSPANEKEIYFSENSEGILTKMSGREKGSEIEILFQEQGKTLVFIKKYNNYELYSVISNGKNPYKINYSTAPIQLLVSGKDNRKAEVNVAAVYYADPPEIQPLEPAPYKMIPAKHNDDYRKPVFASRNVMGCGAISIRGVIKYAEKTRHSALSKYEIAIINEYFKEAECEGVNADIAIAQMLYLTDFFRNQKIMSSHNYAGLRDIPSSYFKSMHMGVQAHIQHLMAYANETPSRKIVDPRYKFAYQHGFCGIRFEHVYKHWSENRHYGQSIDDILCDLYDYSGAR